MPLAVASLHVAPGIRLRRDVQHLAEAPVPRPLRPDDHPADPTAGDGADHIGKQSGGWTLSWQGAGNKNSDFPNGESIYAGLQGARAAGGGKVELSENGRFTSKPDLAVVVFGKLAASNSKQNVLLIRSNAEVVVVV